MSTTLPTFKDTASNTSNKDYQIANMDIKFKGERINLGGLFVNAKSSKVLKMVFQLIQDGKAQPADFDVAITGIYDSATVEDVEADVELFK